MGSETETEGQPPAVTARPAGRHGRRPTILFCVAVALAAVVAVVVNPLAATAASTRAAAHKHHGHKGPVHQAQPTVAPGVATSPNWSGYVAQSQLGAMPFNQVTGSWVQNKVTCPRNDAWTLFWVGFDGWPKADATVEQGGTSARCVHGVPHYSAFYEMWPAIAVTDMFPVNVGDQISSSVVYSTTTRQYLITVTDVTTGTSQTETEACPASLTCARTSAEWIAESPSHFGTNKWFPLANYHTMGFTQASATNAQLVTGPISGSQWTSSGIDRFAGSANAVAKVSNLKNSGTSSSFSDTWHRR